MKGSKDTKIKPSEDGSENKFFPRKLLALDNPEEGRKRTRGVLQLLFTHQVSQGEAIPGALTFSFSWYRTGLRTEKGCSTAVLHEHTVQDSLKSQDTAAANSLSCLFIIEETHSSKFCVGFSVTRSFLVVTAPQLWSQHSHYYRSLFWKGKELTLKTKNWGGKLNNFSKTTHFKYDNIYKSLKGMNYPVMEKAVVILATEST